jgi:hypothetical protein
MMTEAEWREVEAFHAAFVCYAWAWRVWVTAREE